MRKRILSALLVVAMLLGVMLTTTGCNAILTCKKVEKEPTEHVLQALENTLAQSKVPDAASPLSYMMEAMKQGYIEVALLDNGATITLHADGEAKSYGLVYSAQGDDIGIYAGDHEFVIDAKPILGTDKVYGVNTQTMKEDAKNSPIWNMLGVSYDEVFGDTDGSDISATLVEELMKLEEEDKLEELSEALKKLLDDCVSSTETGSVISGAGVVKSINVTYVFKPADLQKIMMTTLAWAGDDCIATVCEALGASQEDGKPITIEYLQKQLAELSKAANGLDIKVIVSLTEDAKRVIAVTCTFTMTPPNEKGEEEDKDTIKTAEELAEEKRNTTSIQLTFDFGGNPSAAPRQEYRIAYANGLGESEGYISLVIERIVGKNTYDKKYTLTINEGEGEESKMNFDFSLNQKTGDYNLHIYTGFVDTTISGVYTVKDGVAQMTVTSTTSDGRTEPANVVLKFVPGKHDFAIPAYTNIFTASEAELQPIMDMLSMLGGFEEDYEEEWVYEDGDIIWDVTQ